MTESYRGFHGLWPGKFQIAETVVARLTWGLPDGGGEQPSTTTLRGGGMDQLTIS